MKNKNNEEVLFEQIVSDRDVRKGLAKTSLKYFIPIYFHHYIKYEAAPFHHEIFQILEDVKTKLAVIVAFRGSAKSTIVTTAYILWSILGVQQMKFIVICSQTEQKARQHLVNIKNELLLNALLKMDLGPFEEEKNSLGNATALIIKKLNVKIMISSTEQSIRGMRHGEHRPDLIILDDIEDIDSVKTREGRNKAFDWLTGEVIPAGSEKTRIVAVGNLLHEDSVLRRLQRKIEGNEFTHLKSVYREYPIINENNIPLWPAKYPTQESIEAERQKTMDEVAWYREYMLKIISTADQIIHPEWINTYDKLPLSNNLQTIVIGVDLAISLKDTADYTSIVTGYVYGYGEKMKIYVRPNPINLRITFPEQVSTITTLATLEKPSHHRLKIYIEKVGYQDALVHMLQLSKYDVVGVPATTDKITRLQLTTAPIKSGQILFPRTGCEELIEQLVGFGKEKHDDLADAFALMVLNAIEHNKPTIICGVGRPDAL